ncbi:hydroxypyruvate isomerase family protein [Tepidimonas charontis]|uniref:Hydroxypyruvate isomerase n=1 Tax=Tepidimonas charontis TaxID=2267262 RepID=A0A554X7X0_9BURK|nr:TIM barrel protein [Tepidimonas charontis]TSE31866.1 Hydroxypyruvate isomerase [Tepidimonas charontis]
MPAVVDPRRGVRPAARWGLAANISLLFAERPLLQRLDAAAAGFVAVECQFPYAVPAQALADRCAQLGLRWVLHNLPAGDWAAGERGIACHPQRVAEFRAGIGPALDYACTLQAPQVNVIAGGVPAGVTRTQALSTLVDNLRAAAEACARFGIGLRLEAINSVDIPGFLVDRVEVAWEVIERVGWDGLRLQFDAYHVARMGQDPVPCWRQCHARVGHVQWADCPGRHEPGSAAVDFSGLLAAMDESRWSGWVGAEYVPADPAPGGTERGLGWIEALGLGRACAGVAGVHGQTDKAPAGAAMGPTSARRIR